MKLKIHNKTDFIQKFLVPISRINDLCTLKIHSDSISSLIRTPDNNFVLHAIYSEIGVDDELVEKNISFADIKRFIKAFECTEGEDVDLLVNDNNIEYKSTNVKFKFHLINDNLVKSPNFNLDKINSLNYNINSKISLNTILSLIKSSTFITDSNKIYIKATKDGLYGELSDKTRDNIDSFTTKLSDELEGSVSEDTIILNFDIFRILSALKTQDIDIRLNTERGYVAFDIKDDKYKLKYIATSMVS
jgi:hypothetical protein